MARVTVEDCVLKVPNRFELVLLAAQRAREITSGAPLSLDRDDDKNPVVALREIADETIQLANLTESHGRGMQKHIEIDEPEETPDLEETLFGVADPADAVIGEDELDEEAVEDELDEDMLAIADEDEIEASERTRRRGRNRRRTALMRCGPERSASAMATRPQSAAGR